MIHAQLDQLPERILAELRADARVSPAAHAERVRRLEESGVIMNPSRLSKRLTALAGELAEVLKCHR